jgi:glycosyltransferase involved in cell wall biosynthesis
VVACGIDDHRLAEYYSQARYVSGLRRGEGFELPVVEGLACGARPICFDLPCYTHWFAEHAVFVPESGQEELTDALTDIFRRTPRPVSPAERSRVLETFSWESICRGFWMRLCGQSS